MSLRAMRVMCRESPPSAERLEAEYPTPSSALGLPPIVSVPSAAGQGTRYMRARRPLLVAERTQFSPTHLMPRSAEGWRMPFQRAGKLLFRAAQAIQSLLGITEPSQAAARISWGFILLMVRRGSPRLVEVLLI